jgi:peptide/nickel transport system substrate-binding protein
MRYGSAWPHRGIRGRAAAAAVVVTLALAGCGGTPKQQPTTPASSGKAVAGGTATYALPPNTTPNYIFPFSKIDYFSVANSAYLQALMYRPLYWFGSGGQAKIDDQLSLAAAPKYSGTTVTITLKDYKWSDGTPVSSTDVLFWMNMMKAEKANWADYIPGAFPDNVKTVTADSPTQVTFTLDKQYSSYWFTYNELSQITPMPQAWDKTSDTAKGNCSTSVDACHAVYAYLAGKAKDQKSYATDPLWQVVDGPWKLQSYNADGHVTFVPNPGYSGPNKPHLASFKLAPFTTEDSEYNVLRSGGHAIDVGYLPTVAAAPKPADKPVGPNPVASYTLDPLYLYGINYFPYNFNNPDVGPIFKQTYFRQALQYLVDQKSVIDGPLKGYGVPTTGPVPILPPTFASAQSKAGDPFPYNPDTAKQLLASHGWAITPNGVSACTDPSLCGAGVKKGQTLEFQLLWATGNAWIESFMKALQSNASRVGIKIDLKGAPFNQVTGTAIPCKPTEKTCDWQMGNWGGGWVFVPDYYPSGETLFQTGAGSNSGSYADPRDDQMIVATTTDSSPAVFSSWQDYLAKQVPVVWAPNGVYELTEVYNKLQGVLPQNPFAFINPENWYFTQ